MKVGFNLVIRKEFYNHGDIEYPVTPEPDSIMTAPNYESALAVVTDNANRLKNQGYKLINCGNGEYESPVVYRVRYENKKGQAVVYEIQYRTVEGDLFRC